MSTSASALRGDPPRHEYRTVVLARSSTSAARLLLTQEAELGHWEVVRVRLYAGGRREVLLRRRLMRVVRTLGPLRPPPRVPPSR